MRKRAWVLGVLLVVSLVGLGAQARKVVAYTAHEDDIIAGMVPRFKADTGITLEFVKLASGDVIKRVVAEANNPQCDVIWSIGGEQLEASNNVLEGYVPKDWDKIDPVFKVGTNWLPYTGIMNVLIVNTKLVPESQMPKKWADLLDKKWKGKISSATPDKSGSSYMQLNNVLLAFKDRGWDTYRGIAANFFISVELRRGAEVRERRRGGHRHHPRGQRVPLCAGRRPGQDRLPRGGRDRGARRDRARQGRSAPGRRKDLYRLVPVEGARRTFSWTRCCAGPCASTARALRGFPRSARSRPFRMTLARPPGTKTCT